MKAAIAAIVFSAMVAAPASGADPKAPGKTTWTHDLVLCSGIIATDSTSAIKKYYGPMGPVVVTNIIPTLSDSSTDDAARTLILAPQVNGYPFRANKILFLNLKERMPIEIGKGWQIQAIEKHQYFWTGYARGTCPSDSTT